MIKEKLFSMEVTLLDRTCASFASIQRREVRKKKHKLHLKNGKLRQNEERMSERVGEKAEEKKEKKV